MAAKGRMGFAEGESLFSKKKGRTAGAALAEVMGGSSPAVAPEPVEQPPAAQGRAGRPVVTNVRIWPDQLDALRNAAVQRAKARGMGKPDFSEIIRELLDGWMAKQAGE